MKKNVFRIISISSLAIAISLTGVSAFATEATTGNLNVANSQIQKASSPTIIFEDPTLQTRVSESYINQLKKDYPNAKQITIQRMDPTPEPKPELLFLPNAAKTLTNPGEVSPQAWFDFGVSYRAGFKQLVSNDIYRNPYILYEAVAKGQTKTTTSAMERTATTSIGGGVLGGKKDVWNISATGNYTGSVKSTVTKTTVLTGPPESSSSNSRKYYMQAAYGAWTIGVDTLGFPSGDFISGQLISGYIPVWLYFSVDN